MVGKKEMPTTPPRPVDPTPATSAKSGGTFAAIKDFDIPATQESDSGEDELFASAKKTLPIPTRKAVLKEEVAKKREMKRPAAMKKPAAEKDGKQKVEPFADEFKVDGPLLCMPYKKLGSCAVRIKNGRQLIQVVSPQGLKHSVQLAKKMKRLLEDGKSLGEEKAWKLKKLASLA